MWNHSWCHGLIHCWCLRHLATRHVVSLSSSYYDMFVVHRYAVKTGHISLKSAYFPANFASKISAYFKIIFHYKPASLIDQFVARLSLMYAGDLLCHQHVGRSVLWCRYTPAAGLVKGRSLTFHQWISRWTCTSHGLQVIHWIINICRVIPVLLFLPVLTK